MLIAPGSKLVMIGDSITDADRAKPHGEGLFEPYGRGYVNHVNAWLGALYPERRIRVVNKGLSGNTVRDLKARWQADVLDLKPDWVSIMIGINDVWRQYDVPLQLENHVLLPEYEATLDELCAKTRPAVKGLVLFTPYYIEANASDAMRHTMDQYGAAVARLAKKHGALFVDTQAVYNHLLQHLYAATLAWDRVHPTSVGHAAMARAFLKAVGAEF